MTAGRNLSWGYTKICTSPANIIPDQRHIFFACLLATMVRKYGALVVVLLLPLLDGASAFLPFVPHRSIESYGLKLSSTESTAVSHGSEKAIQLARDLLQPYFSFPLDDWQLQAGGEIFQGSNVIVCAPTGAGKTVVGEMALRLALDKGQNAIYTTPLKALSNQKFAELRQIFGKLKVGLSTGDMSINRNAQLRVMTTEVYRNMAWRSSGLEGKDGSTMSLDEDELVRNGVVVLDEFHYMGQPGRGGVWEESVITTPSHSQIVGLSATLPNAQQLAQWMESVSGRKTVLVEAGSARPVPLRYLFATKKGLYPLFQDEDAGPGAPKGLLGLRGDGIPESSSQSKKKGGFAKDASDDTSDLSQIPPGLQINSVLKALAQKRRMRVNKAIERMQNGDESTDDQTYNRGGGRWKNDLPRSGKVNAREERRERERLLKREMRKEVPSLSMLIRRLDQKNLLPAILFIFSRAGCDNAASELAQQFTGLARDPFSDDTDLEADDEYDEAPQERKRKQGRSRAGKAQNRMQDKEGRVFRRGGNYIDDDSLASMLDLAFTDDENMTFDDASPLSPQNWKFFASAGLLKYDEVKEVAFRVSTFNSENEEIAFEERNVEQFLLGVGSHHAGMLPAHKAFVETLYRAQLMKVVFATETLAAGINMPARTTCICSLAKRGDGSTMNLLETSNLLQMAGRAGRRGMDTDGTCVILSTPFENEDDASKILISQVKPVTSQFAPSYSLAVNLISRGQGKVDVARRLVEKSFAMWEKRQVEAKLELALEADSDGSVVELLAAASHERFMTSLVNAFLEVAANALRDANAANLKEYANLVQDKKLLKVVSKGYGGLISKLNMERKTLQYLEDDLADEEGAVSAQAIFENSGDKDKVELFHQIQTYRSRVRAAEQNIARHPFTAMAEAATSIMEKKSSVGETLAAEFGNIRKADDLSLTADDLFVFAKSVVTLKKKKKSLDEIDSDDLIREANKQVTLVRDATWRDMLALTKVLVSYGCLKSDWTPGMSDDDLESSSFSLTTAGEHIGQLSVQNSLWCLVAMGGAHDVVGVSSRLDDFRRKMMEFDNEISSWDDEVDDRIDSMDDVLRSLGDTPQPSLLPSVPHAQEESLKLASQLSSLTAHELAGYVSSLISDGYRRGSSVSVAESFQKLTPAQQRVVQSCLAVCERLVDVQREFDTGDTNTKCELDLTNVQVVTAWASGCSWAEALETSGSAPGDLARMLGRVLDALRQLGNLTFNPIRASDYNPSGVLTASLGISSDVRNLCRDAARAMNRFPVKDPLPFETDASEEIEDDFDDDEDNFGE
jgi:superfamily II RNA helicase